jgi:hypothetical protein
VNKGLNVITFSNNRPFSSAHFLFYNSSDTLITTYVSNGNLSDLIWNDNDNLLNLIDFQENHKFNIKLYFEYYFITQQTFPFDYIYYSHGSFQIKIDYNLTNPSVNQVCGPYLIAVEIKPSKKFNK